MSTAGGPDSIGELRVDVVGDTSALDASLAAAAQKAQQQGEEIGRALNQGVASQGGVVGPGIGGGIGGVGGGINGPGAGGVGGGIAGPGMGGGVAAGGVPITPPAGGGGGAGGGAAAAAGGGGINPGAVNAAAVGVAFREMLAVAEKFEKVGEFIGNAIMEGTKTQLELTQAIRLMQQSLSAQQAINASRASQQARGVGGRAPSTAMQDRLAGFETENAAIDASLAENPTIGDALAGAAEFLTFNPFTGESDVKSRRTQMREQRADNQGSIDSLRRQQGGMIQAGRQNTSGRVLADAAEDAGIPFNPTMRNSGDAMTPANAALMGDVLKGQKQLIEMLIRQGTFEGQQQTIRQVTTQGNP